MVYQPLFENDSCQQKMRSPARTLRRSKVIKVDEDNLFVVEHRAVGFACSADLFLWFFSVTGLKHATGQAD